MGATCQQCQQPYPLDVEADTIVRHEMGGKRCSGSYKPSREFMAQVSKSNSVTLFRGTITQTGEIKCG